MNKVSYALGLGIGRQLAQMGAEDLNIDDFAQAIKDIIAGNEPKVSDAEAQTIVQDFFKKQEEKQRAAAAERFKGNKEAGEKYLADNAQKDGVVTLPSGLQYKVLNEGNGKKPKATDTVKCHYLFLLNLSDYFFNFYFRELSTMTVLFTVIFSALHLENNNLVTLYQRIDNFTDYFGTFYGRCAHLY